MLCLRSSIIIFFFFRVFFHPSSQVVFLTISLFHSTLSWTEFTIMSFTFNSFFIFTGLLCFLLSLAHPSASHHSSYLFLTLCSTSSYHLNLVSPIFNTKLVIFIVTLKYSFLRRFFRVTLHLKHHFSNFYIGDISFLERYILAPALRFCKNFGRFGL